MQIEECYFFCSSFLTKGEDTEWTYLLHCCDLFHHTHLTNVQCFQISTWTVALTLVLCKERWGRTSAYQFIQRATILKCFNAFLRILRTGVMVQLHWHVPNLHDSWNRLWDVSKIDWAVAFKIIAAWIWNEHFTGVNTVLKSEGFYAFFCWYFLAADSFLQDWVTRARVHWFTFWRLSFQ